MKSFITLILAVALIAPAVGQKKGDKKSVTEKTIKLTSNIDSVSYGLGVLFGGNLSQSGFKDINTTLMAAAINEVLSAKTTLYNEQTANEIVGNYFRKMQAEKSGKNIQAGNDFLEKNKKEKGVVVLPSGLQYLVIKDGTGEKPGPTDKVTVHYHGTLIDGRVFDSSVDRGQPIPLTVNGVIKGWQEALQLMTVGSKWKLVIPSDLAYGDQQMQGSIIEPNSVLVFEVELISIDKEEPIQPAIQPAIQSIEQPQIQPK